MMRRYVSLEEISDGKLYTANDMVKADCLGCQGCSRCCHEMGDTILLDPYDIWRFQKGLGKDAQTLLAEGKIALRVVDSVIVPHLKMQPVDTMKQGEKSASNDIMAQKEERVKGDGTDSSKSMDQAEEKCPFLDEKGWCTIHAYRPGLCRLFPLGRYYEGDGFRYFLQKSECDHPKAKVKVSKWLDVPELPKYEQYVLTWHQIQKQAESLQQENKDEAFGKNLNMFLLKTFFLTPYDADEDFYQQFEERLATYRSIVTV
ncbi:MAG: YkgJ family cysteine cluster protein [Lachnospiraceae bacterium]|nr:YkgJ family cysteine cluster protein [Lachnospiraceae bacterium]